MSGREQVKTPGGKKGGYGYPGGQGDVKKPKGSKK
jgi:hypothetical protein